MSRQKDLEGLVGQLVRRATSLPAAHHGTAAGADGAVLTGRDVQVLRLLASGAGTRAIAEQLVVSPATVRTHRQNILGKLGGHRRLEAVAMAFRRGVL